MRKVYDVLLLPFPPLSHGVAHIAHTNTHWASTNHLAAVSVACVQATDFYANGEKKRPTKELRGFFSLFSSKGQRWYAGDFPREMHNCIKNQNLIAWIVVKSYFNFLSNFLIKSWQIYDNVCLKWFSMGLCSLGRCWQTSYLWLVVAVFSSCSFLVLVAVLRLSCCPCLYNTLIGKGFIKVLVIWNEK